MKKTNKLISILLVLAMLLSMAPLSLTASAASEAISLKKNSYTKVDYSNSATQYYQYNNYLYKAAYSNLKNISEVAISYDSIDYLKLSFTESDTGDTWIAYLTTSSQGNTAELSNLPTSSGKSVSFYTSNTVASNAKKPVITVTCMAVNEPVWSWNGVSSATAAFTSTDGKTTMTVNAAIESSEQTAVTCLENDKTTYTATATANGKAYTNEKTVDGEQGPHSFEYSGDDVIGSCTNGCGYECPHENQTGETCEICGAALHTHSFTYSASGDTITAVCANADGNCTDTNGGTLTILAPADLYADGITAKEATIENNLVDTSVAISDITYSAPYGLPPKDAGTYTASVTVGGATATGEFTLLNYAAKVTDKDGNAVGTYKTFEDAITAAEGSEGSTVTLLDDVTLTETLNIGGAFTIDLNGKTLNCTSGNTIYIYPNGNYVLTVEDFSEDKSGVLKSETGQAVNVSSGGKLILNSGTVTAENDYAISAVSSGFNYSLLEVHGGTVNGKVFCYGDSVISGGIFNDPFIVSSRYISNKFSGGIFNGGIKINSNKSLNNILADGCYFRNAEGKITDGSSNSIEEKVTIEKGADLADAVITLDSTEITYNGSEIKPTVIVTIGGKTLTEGKDYTLTFANNVNAGTATVTVTGAGDYTGEATKEFTIVKADNTVNAAPTPNTLTYNGEAQNLISAGEAMYGTMVYSLNGEEYSETIPQGTDAGDYTVYYKVIGDSNHNDTEPATVIVTINAKDISDGFIILGDALTYNGKEQTQTVEKVIPTGTAPEATYTVSGNKATNVGVYLLTVTGTGNFTGEAKIAYEIAVDASGVEGLTIENVKSSDKENVEYVYNQLENAVKDLADEDKISEWNTLQSYCAAMRQRIEIVENQIKAFENKLGEYDIDTVTSDDDADLESFQNSVGNFYNDYYDNLTDEQEKKITDIYSAIEDLETRISDVAEEITRITNAVNGYDEATVKYGDYKDILQLIDDIEALTTGKNITDFERADLEELNTKANLLAAKIRSTADEISRITRAVNAYSIDTVKSSDKADIENLIARIKKLTDGDNITDDERANLNELDSTLDALLAKIDETADEITRITNAVNSYDEATVKSSDETDLEQLKAEIKALTDGQNITADERAKLENLDATADALLAKIAETTAEYDRVIAAANGYDEATVTSADKDALVQLNDDIYALALTDNVTAEEKENLQAAHNKVLGLIDKITAISNEIKRIIEAVDKYVFESVKSSDKTDIEQLISDIKALLDTQNITADERTLLLSADETCTKLIEKIDETVAEINRINDATNAYDIDTVTSADKADIEKLLADIKALTDGDNITDTEREQLNGNDATLNALLDKIGATADEIERIETAVNGYDEESVKSTDKGDLEKLKADIKTLTDATNITEDERTKLGELYAKIDALIKKIDDTAAEIERIDEAVNGYDKETVTSDDVPELGKLIDDIKALTDGDNLTEDEKAALEEADKAIDDLVEKLAEVAEEIKKVDEAVKSYDEETVKSSDSEDLAQLKEEIQSLIDSDNVTESEKTVLEDMIADVEGLEDKIAETEQQLEEIKDIENNFNPETVSSDDKSAIEEAIAEIEAVNPDNLTDEQKAEYEEIKAGFEALLEEIAAAEKNVADIGIELEKFDEERVTKFWEDDIEALKAKIDELLADENMGETEKAKLNEYKAQAEKLIETINTPVEYFSLRFFYLIWDCLTWKYNGILWLFKQIFAF